MIHCKILKLINGQDIIVHTDSDGKDWFNNTTLCITDPVTIQPYRFPKGNMVVETTIMTPWVKMADYDVIEIPTKNILAVIDVKAQLIEQYETFVKEIDLNDSKDIEIGEPENIEEFIDNMFSHDELEEEDEYDTRTIH